MKLSTDGAPNQLDVFNELGYKSSGHLPFTEEEYNASEIYIEGYDPETDIGRPTWSEIDTKWDEMKSAYVAEEYARNRALEYPSVEEITVALYDPDDKAAIDAKRAAIKTKWPKDNSGPVE